MDYFLAESAEEQSATGDVNHSTIHAPFRPNCPYTSYEGPISTNQNNQKLGAFDQNLEESTVIFHCKLDGC